MIIWNIFVTYSYFKGVNVIMLSLFLITIKDKSGDTGILQLLETCQRATLLHWVTCSFNTLNTFTVVYFVSFPYTPFRKKSLSNDKLSVCRPFSHGFKS